MKSSVRRAGSSVTASLWKVKRMKAARLVVLVVAVAAGGVAALLAGRRRRSAAARPRVATRSRPSTSSLPRPTSARPGASRRRTCGGRPGRLQAASPNFIRKIGSPRRNRAAHRRDRARAPSRRRADARSQADQGQRLRLSWRRSCRQGHARDLDRNLAGNRRRRLHPAERPCRRDPVAPRTRSREGGGGVDSHSAKPSSPTSACSRSTRRSRRKMARGSWSARPRRSNSRRARPRSSRCRASSARCRWRCAASPMRAKPRCRTTTTRLGQARRNQHGALRRHHRDHAEMS